MRNVRQANSMSPDALELGSSIATPDNRRIGGALMMMRRMIMFRRAETLHDVSFRSRMKGIGAITDPSRAVPRAAR
jgi:hypothetical protein